MKKDATVDEMSDDIIFMLAKFPDHRELILREYRHNEEFKCLVEDFYSISQLLEGYRRKMNQEQKNEQEYKEVFLELEKEITRFLNKQKI